MQRRELILAALAASGGAAHSPVQVQKLFFLIDKKIPDLVGGPFFKFEPFDYGPFDPDVYREIEALEPQSLVQVQRNSNLRWRRYQTTISGQAFGQTILDSFDPRLKEYFSLLSKWVRAQSFAELVSAIYREYPEMKANSVFNG